MDEYKPGTLAVATVRGVPNVRVMRTAGDTWNNWCSAPPVAGSHWHTTSSVTNIVPCAVLEFPSSTSAYEFTGYLTRRNVWLNVARQIEQQVPPPKPEVYEHLVDHRNDEIVVAKCGKVWIPKPDVTVIDKCPECLSAVKTEEWIA